MSNNPEDPSLSGSTTEPDIVTKAKEEREKLRLENERMEKNIKEARELAAHKALSGDAGGHVEPIAKPETDAEYRKRIIREVNEGKYNAKRQDFNS